MNAWFSVSAPNIWELLIQQCIQVTVLILCVLLLARFFAKDRPHLAHALWGLVLLKCLTPPMFALPLSPFCLLRSSTESRSTISNVSVMTRAGSLKELAFDPGATLAQSSRQPSDVSAPQSTNHPAFAPFDAEWISKRVPSERSRRTLLPGGIVQSKATSETKWTSWAVGAWAISAFLSLLIAAARLTWFLRKVRNSRIEPASTTLETLDQLLAELPQRRWFFSGRVRLVVVDSLIGPAVVGLLRPRVLLPRVLESQCAESELRLLLAHELTHIRRGDLWWALLQTTACCLWWFHPLVHWVSRLFDRVTEQSCDEETVASLHCQPAEYARSLLSVLERKHLLHSAPALPGVRPVELTVKRMERIMKLTSNARAQRPWWVVPVLLIGAACVLPGAALSIAGDQAPPYPPKDATWQVEQASANEPAPRPGTPIPTSTPQFVKTYDAKPAIEKIKQEDACTDAQAEAILYSSLTNVLRLFTNVAPTGVIVDGDRVIVRGDDSSHNRVKRELERIEKYGFMDQVTMDAKFVSMASDKFSKLPLDWALIPQDTGSTPVLMVLLNPAELRSLVEQVQGDARSNLLHSPRVTLFNGQEGNIADMIQRPFVVGLQNPASESPEAKIRIEKSGVELTLCPEMDERFIDLDVRCYRSVIEDVSTFSFQSGGKTCGVQVPKVVRQQFLTKTDLPHGHSLAYAMPDLSDPEIVSLVILTATPVSMIEQQANTDVSASATSPSVNSDITFFHAQPYATVPAVAEVNAESDAEDEPVLIKADGPRMSDEDTLKLTKAIRKFGWAPHFEGTFEFEISDEKVRIKGKNIALSEDNDDLLIASPSGEIVLNLLQKTMHFQADTVLDFAFDDSALKVQGKELSLSENGLRITGSPLRFEIKEYGFRGVSESLSYGNDLQFTGNVKLQTGDTKLSADKVELFDEGESHELHLLGNVSFNGTVPANGTVEQYSVDTKAVSMKYNLKTGEFDMP